MVVVVCDMDTASGVFLTAAVDQNTLLLPTLTDSGTPALTLTSPHLVHSCLQPPTRKNISKVSSILATKCRRYWRQFVAFHFEVRRQRGQNGLGTLNFEVEGDKL